ncbi:MAG: SLBB domain-containing protein [Oscillospiraceae bacterium]|nr:SLBB domain-containing protein [Oscillospiraceae bacterium]
MEEVKVLTKNCGKIDPESAEEYLAAGGYTGLKKALTMSGQEIIDLLKAAGLRGRGGAGFPTYRKIQFTYDTQSDVKYVVCNADEGEPGTNKDRILLSQDPLKIIEGMTIVAKAIGAHVGYIYLRGEYSYIRNTLYAAMRSAEKLGYLGKDILGSGFDFEVRLASGAGAYVCGEESALFESIEGRRGEPRFRPPFPSIQGLFGKPTVLNNVETLANIGPIFAFGAEWFRSMGTAGSPGTKLFTVIGNVNKRGIYEFPMGINLKDLIYDCCGGIEDGHALKAVQAGGASGTYINADQIDMILDIDQVSDAGGRLGCGTIIVIDDTNCIVDIVCNNAFFFKEESCGKCTPCREGTTRLYEFVNDIAQGRGSMETFGKIERLTQVMNDASLCGLGRSATVPVTSAIRNFYGDFISHIDKDYCEHCRTAGSI